MFLFKVLLGILICSGVIPETISQPVKHPSFHKLHRRHHHHHTQHHLDIDDLTHHVDPQIPLHDDDQPSSGKADDGSNIGMNLDSNVR